MNRLLATIVVLTLSAATVFTQTPAVNRVTAGASRPAPLVEFEMMTWPEVKAALAAGRTTALVYTGGTEQRGPQDVNGGHTLMARATVTAIALKLGNAIAMPVLAYSPNRASADLPGTIGLTPDVFAQVLTEIAEQSITTGFKNVILMGDHGGGQPHVFAAVARKLDQKYGSKGTHVYYCDDVYAKAQGDMERWLEASGYPRSSHAGIPDTSEMMYLGGDKGWVRTELIKDALGDPLLPRGRQVRDPGAPRINNGVTGDGRQSTPELGKKAFDMKVEYAVRQIQEFLNRAPKGAASRQR
jgi:creatinine amidohydrolase/Fe(II)-dependent formamide hydrolase-like protein